MRGFGERLLVEMKTRVVLVSFDQRAREQNVVIGRIRSGLLEFAEGEWWIEDSGSTNGTLVNGEVVRSRERVQYGDEVAIGRVALRLEQ